MTEEMRIVDSLVLHIHSGKYNPDDKLPSENELAEQFNVPRIKVRKAYERMQEQGYIYSRQGKGSYVKDRRNQIPLVLSGDVSFSKKMVELGYHCQSKNVFCNEIEYDEKIFHSLGICEDGKVYRIGRLRIVDQMPIALHISYVAKSTFPDMEKTGRDITSMFEYYHTKGFTEFMSGPSIVSVIFPSKEERVILDCSSLVPLLALESACIDKETGSVLEHTQILYRSDCFTYVI